MISRKKYDYDLIVFGSGSGGSVGAHYAASKGKKVLMFEAEDVGGECPNWACVPTKALLHSAHVYTSAKNASNYGISIPSIHASYPKIKAWKDLVVARTGAAHGKESFEKHGIHLIHRKAAFISPHEVLAGDKVYSAEKFLIATGSKVFVPPISGLEESGYSTFKQAVDFTKPPASLLIFGGGAVACEFATIFSSFGTKVTLINRSDRLLGKEDIETSELVKALFEYDGIVVKLLTVIDKVEKKDRKKKVHLRTGNQTQSVEVEQILIATGKVPVLDFSPEKAGIVIKDNRLWVNKYLQTSAPHIYAAGDIVGPYLFTHTGYYQSYIAMNNAFSRNKIIPDYRVVPRCVFISPEVASVGMTEDEAKEKGISIKKGIVAIGVVGRANTSNELDGFVKVITDKSGVIIGGAIVAPSAGEMIHEIALAMKLKVKASVLAEMMHAYPTYSEAIKIACSVVE